MHVVTMRKKPDMRISVPSPKGRLRSAPCSQWHKDKRRKTRNAERASLRKELD